MRLSAKLQGVALSDRGMVRELNEDYVYWSAELGLAVLADGMGGYNAGEVASELAVITVVDELRTFLSSAQEQTSAALKTALTEAVLAANHTILAAARKEPTYEGMGTTIVAVLVRPDALVVAHIGDSRLYRWRDGQLLRLTRDHSLLQEQLDRGLLREDEARFAPGKNLLTRALGVDPSVLPELGEFPVCSGDRYLLCSDGLNDMLDDIEIAELMTECKVNDLATQLIDHSNVRGGRDNISVVLIEVL